MVGGGPAGLACAFYARLEGHAVKIFEALPKPGGMLRYGIPSYRLPRDVLDKELNMLWRMGVELECDKRLGVDFQMEDLLAQYDAVFLGLGAFNSNEMGVGTKTPTASSRRSTSSGSSSSRATCTWARRSPSSVAGSRPWTRAVPPSARAPRRSPASTAARARRCPPTHTEVDEAEEEGVKLDLLVAP